MLVIVECDEDTCTNNKDGYCESAWIELQAQECIAYEERGQRHEANT